MQLNASKMQLKPIPSQYHPYTVGPGLPGPHVLYLSLLIVSYLSVVVSLSLLAVSVRCICHPNVILKLAFLHLLPFRYNGPCIVLPVALHSFLDLLALLFWTVFCGYWVFFFDLLEELYIVVLVELCCLLLEALIIIRKFFRRQIAHRLVLWGVK